ncbi:MAG: DUF6485 family protein [Candidatus Poribacteria bacterium]
MPADRSEKRTNCPNIEINKEKCSCSSKNCERHGFCCECIEYHRSRGGIPSCLRDLK